VSAENPYSVAYRIEELLPLISSRTRLAAITACSNILGSVIPVEETVKALRQRAKEQGATKVEVALDCVAYASHKRMDVQKWDVDYCVFSVYKVSISPDFDLMSDTDTVCRCSGLIMLRLTCGQRLYGHLLRPLSMIS
jgi:hypothetical protein